MRSGVDGNKSDQALEPIRGFVLLGVATADDSQLLNGELADLSGYRENECWPSSPDIEVHVQSYKELMCEPLVGGLVHLKDALYTSP